MLGMAQIDFKGINSAIARNAEAYLSEWLPGGKVHGNEYVCAGLAGGDGESCSVRLDSGVGSDFATGEGWGDFISLYAALNSQKQHEAALELREKTGLTMQDTHSPMPRVRAVMPIPEDVEAPPLEHFDLGVPTAQWWYKDLEGRPLFAVCRFDTPNGNKEFRPLCWTTFGSWLWRGMPESGRPLYGLSEMRGDRPILLSEGEKACDAARRLVGDVYDCLTWPNGAKSVAKANFSPLKGRKVTVWPDNDKPGKECAEKLVSILEGLGCEVTVVTPPEDAPEGWDLADAEAEGWKTERVLQVVAKAAADCGVISMREIFERDYPHDPVVDGLLDMKESMMIVATSGIGKSLLTLQIAFELARERPQLEGDVAEFTINAVNLFDKFNIPKQRRVLFLQSENTAGATQRRFKKMIQSRPDFKSAFDNVMFFTVDDDIRKTGQFTDPAFVREVEKQITKHNIDVLVIDPLISYHGEDENDNASMRRSLDCVTAMQNRTGVAVVLVHHTGKSGSLEGRGASAIKDWAGCIMGLQLTDSQPSNGERYISVEIIKDRGYETPPNFQLVRDKNLTFAIMTKDMRTEKQVQDMENVVAALRELGGECDSSSKLQVHIMNKHKVQNRTARDWIKQAQEDGLVISILNQKDKRCYGCALSPDGAEGTSATDAQMESQIAHDLIEEEQSIVDKVVAALSEIGGECQTSLELQEKVMKTHDVQKSAAKVWIKQAREAGAIVTVKNPDNKKAKGYALPSEDTENRVSDTAEIGSESQDSGK